MSNSTIRHYLILMSLFMTSPACSGAEQVDIVKCFEAKTQMVVARVDEKNHRIFAIPTIEQQSEEMLLNSIRSSAPCFSDSNWSSDWSVSLFTSKKFAGYKDEKHIIPYHQNNEWAKAYIGEYSGSSQSYIRNPAVEP